MADEVSAAFKLSYELLHADAQLVAIVGDRIYRGTAPQGSILYVLGSFMGGTDVPGLGVHRLMTTPLILWRVVRKGQANADTATADSRMDAVLQNVSAAASGGRRFSFRRESPYERNYLDPANNVWTEVGGYYRYHIS
jgi:hypothetical protein